MIALSVLAISLIAMAQLLAVVIHQSSFAQYTSAGIELARGTLEELRAEYDRELSSGLASSRMAPGSHGPEYITVGDSGSTKRAQRQYEVSWQVVDMGSGVRRVVITVTPQGMTSPETQAPTLAKTISVTGLFAP